MADTEKITINMNAVELARSICWWRMGTIQPHRFHPLGDPLAVGETRRGGATVGCAFIVCGGCVLL